MADPGPFALLEPEGEPSASSSARPVVVLLGWVGAQRDGTLLKYAELLAKHGYTTVRGVQPTGTAFSPFASSRRNFALGLLGYLQRRGLWPQRRLVLFAFSNGGALVVEQLLLLAESDPRYAALQCSVAGFVFDSAPVFVQPGGIERVIATTEPPGLRRWVRTKYFSLAASWVGWGEFFEDMRRLSWGRPLLFLYSADDPLCDGAKVSELVAEKRRRGHDVRARCWERSAHVAHLRHHPEEYTWQLLRFLRDAEAMAEDGGGGTGGAAGSSAAPRSRL